jgi:hypothetical protein
MITTVHETQVRQDDDTPVCQLGTPIRFIAMVFDRKNEDEQFMGFGEYNYDAWVAQFDTFEEAKAIFDNLASRMKDVEEDCIECDNECFLAVYGYEGRFILIGADNGGSDIFHYEVSQMAPDGKQMIHYQTDKYLEESA